MASFPEVVLRVRFRWQQFNKYMVPTVKIVCRVANKTNKSLSSWQHVCCVVVMVFGKRHVTTDTHNGLLPAPTCYRNFSKCEVGRSVVNAHTYTLIRDPLRIGRSSHTLGLTNLITAI